MGKIIINASMAPPASSSEAHEAARHPVAVVGTGIVGLSTALGCAQRGLPVVLVGPAQRAHAASPGYDARIYAISPAARALLETQRVWPQVDASRLSDVARMRIFGDDGGHLSFDARAAQVPRLATICEESALLHALWLACSMAPGLRHLAAQFDAAVFGADSVQLRLSDGSNLDCSLLLGADGRRSAVRAAAGINSHARPYGQRAVVANFHCQVAHQEEAWQWFTNEGVVALLPLPGDRVSLVWSAPDALAQELMALPEDEFARRVSARSLSVLGDLALIGARHAFALDDVAVDALVKPGLALLGDAAHGVHPLAGQGLNLGLQDVSEFLRQLDAREAWRPLGDLVWLRRYARARAEPIGLMRGTVDGLSRLFLHADPRVRRARNLGLSFVDALAPVKSLLIRHAAG
jgi:2-polyprenylphenol 6-hydroxylase